MKETSQPTAESAPPQVLKTPVAIDRIVDLAETRDVRPRNKDHVANLAEVVDSLPAVDVVKLIDNNYGLLNGYHTRDAHRLAGKRTVRVVVHDLPTEEWHRFAVKANIAHGLPLTLDQRKAAAQQMLLDNPGRSDRAIAVDCGLSDKTVGKLRQPEEATAETPQLRVGRDGKTRRVPVKVEEEQPDDEEDDEEDRLSDEMKHLAERDAATAAEVPGQQVDEQPQESKQWPCIPNTMRVASIPCDDAEGIAAVLRKELRDEVLVKVIVAVLRAHLHPDVFDQVRDLLFVEPATVPSPA
jgi:ParB-like chromosome segregation protein Spo0J